MSLTPINFNDANVLKYFAEAGPRVVTSLQTDHKY